MRVCADIRHIYYCTAMSIYIADLPVSKCATNACTSTSLRDIKRLNGWWGVKPSTHAFLKADFKKYNHILIRKQYQFLFYVSPSISCNSFLLDLQQKKIISWIEAKVIIILFLCSLILKWPVLISAWMQK